MSTILQDSPEVLQAYEEYVRFSSDPMMREKYRVRERFLIDKQLDLTEAWEKGLTEGEAKKALETARVTRQEGFNASIIAKITGLSLSEIERLD